MKTLGEGWRSRYWALLAILGMVVALIFTVPATDAFGQGDGVTVTEDAGIILLSTGDSGNNWIRYYEDPKVPGADESFQVVNPTPTAEQILDVDKRCTVTSDDSILELDFTEGRRIAMVSNGLGVGTKNNCSTSEGRISDSDGQTMTFSLADAMFDDVFIESVELDVEAKFGTDVGFIVSDGTSSANGMFDLIKAQDNGPDAGTADNEIATIDQDLTGMPFTSITLFPTASGTEISVEGGGDGTVDGGNLRTQYKANHTLFKLMSVKAFDAGDLSCGDTSTGTAPADEDGPADEIQLWRGANLKTPEDCEDLAYSFRIESDVVLFDANFETQPDAQFLVRIEWDPSSPVVDPSNPPDREIDVDFDGDFDPVEECDSRSVGDDPGADPSADPSIDDTFVHPDDTPTPWCLAGEKLVLLEDGSWQQIQWYHGEGEDPRFR